MASVLFDTSVYVRALRTGDGDVFSSRSAAPGTLLWLNSVVLQELYAGASGKAAQAIVNLQRSFQSARRIVVPSLSDWTSAGVLLARFAEKYGYEEIGRSRLAHDALIAVSSSRLGIELVTLNTRDFARLATIRPFRWRSAI